MQIHACPTCHAQQNGNINEAISVLSTQCLHMHMFSTGELAGKNYQKDESAT